ncbi:MAG: metal ABC transporter permease [Candidatus Brocadia sp. AMX2]|uniref:Metal ABC transporter permease n=1 Tax=Candidatus Brocadia sinica JPN1 TaxID=1197129 RepID=A0ABQ0JZE0_9BACT|nr:MULTISPECIES: metal ABC transporter permease [Brocadia]KXK25014.1 MAG: ABC transporter permease component [Candidatus Brocadia sinica]MBC6932322.1 metal ABC transporter permease [Candidatus Brocadia sp.]MBL1169862.1 metal ABC transporter permease [Candidatus Brocadia sp. AMX1]NOG40305.1 metal ABC transporter permease [Planctomycetota bacterium]KAA0243775.1 MAG: metal ABC transporter permease [Candidatus Brocadia sp. AMX2]
MEQLLEILSPHFLLRNAFYAGLIVGVVCPQVGIFFVLRRMILLGIALPQVSNAGVAFAFLLHTLGWHFFYHMESEKVMALTGSVVFTLITIFVLAILERRRKGFTENRIGFTYAIAGAVSILFVSWNPYGKSEVLSMLTGEIISIPDIYLWSMLAIYGTIFIVLIGFHRNFVLVSYDIDMATTIGKKVILWDIMLYLIIGIIISFGVMTVGPLVIFGFLLIPPVAARMVTRGVPLFCIVSSIIGVIASFAGFYISYRFDLPTGPTDVALLCVILVLLYFGKMLFRFKR